MDADYLAKTVGQPLSLALAEVCIVQPHDPIEWLSGWLYKYVDSADYLREFRKEKWEVSTLESQQKQQEGRVRKKKEEEVGLRISSCNYIASLKDDPFYLWQQAIKAITTFTDCTAVYVAAITEPLWEPKPVTEKKEGEEGEDEEEPEESMGEEGEEDEEKEGLYDSDEEERMEEEARKAEEAAEAQAAAELEEKAAAEAAAKEEADAAAAEEIMDTESETEEEDNKKTKKTKKEEEDEEEEDTEEGKKGDSGGKVGGEVLLAPDGQPLKPPPKPPRPVNYKKLIARYMNASQNNIFMLNKELNRKMGPVTWSVLEKGLPSLHVPNVLYRKGMHYFGGLPRVGAYFVAPVVIRGTEKYPPRVVALLCADTLKAEMIGTGNPFCESEVFFLQEVARAITHAMNDNYLEAIKGIEKDTPDLIEKIKTKFKVLKNERKMAVKKAAKELKAAQKAAAKEKKRLAKEERLARKKKLQEEKAKKKEEARRKTRENAGEETEEEVEEEEDVEEEEEEEENEKEQEEVEEEDEEESDGEKTEDEGNSETGETEADTETEAGTEGAEGEEETEEEPEEPESEPEDWGEEPKEEGEEETEGETDAETDAEGGAKTEVDETEGDETEAEETEAEETEGEETEGEGTEASRETDDEQSETDVAQVLDPELEKKRVEKKAKVEERKKKVAENKKLAKEGAKKIKDNEKELTKLVKANIKYKASLEELGVQMTKLEISLAKGDLIVKHHQLLVSAVMDHILQLKALLIILDHKKFVVDDWIGARLLLSEEFINDLKNYDTFKPQDPMKWKLVESYIIGLTGNRLNKEAPFAYLGLKWILRLKKLTVACAHFLEIKRKYEEQSKAMAAADLAKILGSVNVKVVEEALKKVKEVEEKRLAEVAEEEKQQAKEEARLKAIEDAEAAEAAASSAETTGESETDGETEGDETEADD